MDRRSGISEFEAFRILDCLKATATGFDDIPAWFLRLGASVFAAPIAQLFNQSVEAGLVPSQWKTAVITPVAKVEQKAYDNTRKQQIFTTVFACGHAVHTIFTTPPNQWTTLVLCRSALACYDRQYMLRWWRHVSGYRYTSGTSTQPRPQCHASQADVPDLDAWQSQVGSAQRPSGILT